MTKPISGWLIVLAAALCGLCCSRAPKKQTPSAPSGPARHYAMTQPSDLPDWADMLLSQIMTLPRGMDAAEVLKLVGEPNMWGNWDGDESLDTSWMSSGGYGPLPVPEEKMGYRILAPGNMAPHVLDWVYYLTGEPGWLGPVAILRFHEYKLDSTYTAKLNLIYDP